MRLLERAAALAILEQLRVEAVAEAGRLVFVEGEAGIGKTSLLNSFRTGLEPGVPVLLGSCDPLSTPRPLGPIVDVADDLDAGLAARIREQAPRDEILSALLESLRRHADGVVLLLDDLHWADEATLDALRFVGRRIDSTRALVVGTYRDDEVGRQHPLRVVVGDLATSPAVRRLPLEPLSVVSVGELAAGTDLDPVELHRQTGGNPFYVTEVIAGAPTRIPSTVRDAVLARAARLSPPARRTLEAAAVIGPTVDPRVLERVVDGPAAEECLSRGLLLTTGDRYVFRHEVAREAILDATDPMTRIALHARVLAALEADPGDVAVARLAHHADGAGNREAVLRYAPEAGRQANAAGSHREAAAQFARAVRYAGNLPPAERANLLQEHGREQSLIVRYDIGIPAMAEAVEIWRGLGEPAREAGVLTEMTKALVSMGRNADAEAASRRALEIVEHLPDGPAKVDALATRTYLRMLDRDNAEAIALGRRAIKLGAGDPEAIASVVQAWNSVGSSRILLGDIEGGVADLETSRRLALEHGLDRFVGSAYSVVASALGEMYRFTEADPYFAAGIKYTKERDLDGNRLYLEAWLAITLVMRGRWSEGGALASSVLGRLQGGGGIARMMVLLAAGRLRARRGDPDAREALDDALDLAKGTATLQRIGPVRAARAELAWLSGDANRAADEASAVIELARAKHHPWHIGELSWWLRTAGRPVGPVDDAAEPWRLQLDGRWREAAGAWAALDCPYEAARALLESDEIEAVEEAHATFDRIGARPAAAMATRRLRDLGARSIPRGRRPQTRANPAGLTSRELEVLALLAGGLPNHEIAARLFLSTRTVDHHVSAVLGKLGVARRADAARAAAGLGISLQIGQSDRPD